ncbi:MAG: hypothetical protein Q8S31_02335 [Alphaproteobacteria bacterium]|nr:hypothetical protein [Alphaproteobacteria bacterium]
MIKKISTILFPAFLFFSSTNYLEATFIDDIATAPSFIDGLVESAKPDRSTPWMLFDQPNIQFNEYNISALDLACGFRAFGYASRNDAIDAMLSALADIDEQYENRNAKLRIYIENDCGDNVEDYLKNLKNTPYKLPYTINRYIDSDIDKNLEGFTYTLINAFALLNNISLCIYKEVKDEKKTISLTHSFICDESDKTLHLLCRRLHYNKLVFTSDENENLMAQDAENNYLSELHVFYERESSNKVMQPSFNNPLFNRSFSSNNSKTSNTPNVDVDVQQKLFNNITNMMFLSNQQEESTINNIIEDGADKKSTNVENHHMTTVHQSVIPRVSGSIENASVFNIQNNYLNVPEKEAPGIDYIKILENEMDLLSVNIVNDMNSERERAQFNSNNQMSVNHHSDNIIDYNSLNNISYNNDDNMDLGDDFYYNPNDFN